MLSLLFVWIPNITITTTTVHYIYILHRSFRTLATTQIHPLLSRASAMFTGQFHSTSMRMICRLPCNLRASYGNPWISPTSLDNDPLVDFPHLRFTIGSGMCWCYVLAVQTWRSEKKVRLSRTAAWKQPLVFFAIRFATNQGSWQYSRSRSSFHNIRNLVCSIYGLSISAGLHIMSATCSTWFRWRYVN